MANNDTDRLLGEEERALQREVERALAGLARELADELNDADEITAAAFSIRSIAQRWRSRVPQILRRLFRTAEASVDTVAEELNADTPEDWDSLPERYDSDTLPPAMQAYRSDTERLLNAVGEELTDAAARELAAGIEAGEDTDALRARLLALFGRDGTALGSGRAARIAVTETTRAWNAAAHGAAEAYAADGLAVVKQWRTRQDSRVREAHREAEGQLRLVDETFTVGGYAMRFPGDPTAPADLVINCRCVLAVSASERSASLMASTEGPHPGGMIALIPTAEDAGRIAVDGGEAAEELHCTLRILTEDAADWSDVQRAGVVAAVEAAVTACVDGPVDARLFGVNQWNPADAPVWVWATGDAGGTSRITDVLNAVDAALGRVPELPPLLDPYTPYVAHVTAQYGGNPAAAMVDRLGPITFDRVRVVFAGEVTDILLTPGTDDVSAYQPGDRVMITVTPHEEGHASGTVTQVHPGPAYGITFDGTDTVHHWYVGDELAPEGSEESMPEDDMTAAAVAELPSVRTWTTPDDAALAFENKETGDGRIFAPEALYWEGSVWPLQYCESMGAGHDGAELAGAIQAMGREADRLTGNGVLYMTQPAGWEAATLLDQGAPLGVSVDLDDVTAEIIDRVTPLGDEDAPVEYTVRFSRMSLFRHANNAWTLKAVERPVVSASLGSLASAGRTIHIVTGPGGTLDRGAAQLLVPGIAAAAGDPDNPDASVVHTESAGDVLMRITRARVRGATLVAMPAYDQARIVIDPLPTEEVVTSAEDAEEVAASVGASEYERVVRAVWGNLDALSSVEISEALGVSVKSVRSHLRTAIDRGHIVRVGRRYAAPATLPEFSEVSAAVTGATDLPVASRDADWDGDAAVTEIFEWADGDTGKLGMAFLWKDDNADASTQAAWKLPFARPVDGTLTIIPNGVFAIASVLQGGRGGVDVPEGDMDSLRSKVNALYERLSEELGEDFTPPWDAEDDDSEESSLLASAWTAMQSAPPMPAHWFKEPTTEELPPGSGGVHYKDGRVYGWVAQAGVPHASHGAKVTIDKLAAGRGLDLTHFLRQRFVLDDGSEVKAGAFTMNVGHHRDGYECETAACQFDDTRTVAAIVTVGMNEGGLWFSGAAAPWLSQWDSAVFAATQPSYHMTQGSDGRWQLRAVLSVPVPGHSSPLVASLVERSNLALAASAAMALPITEPVVPITSPADTLAAALADPTFLDKLTAALDARAASRAETRRAAQAMAATLGIDGPTTEVKE
jgi:hypothetical protein